MAAIKFPDLVDDRADVLQSKGLDGLKLALVSLPAGVDPDHADIDLRFFNGLHVAAILADIGGDPVRARQVFRIRGGALPPAEANGTSYLRIPLNALPT